MKCYCCGIEDKSNSLTAAISGWKPLDTPSGGIITLCANCSRATNLDIMNVINRHRELRQREIVIDIPYKEVETE